LAKVRQQLASGVKEDGSRFSDDDLIARRAYIEKAETWVDANENVQFTLPSITIEEPYTVDAGAASFTVYPLRGHTRGDLIVHFAELGLLATGDLVDEMPFSGHGYPEEWIAALQTIE
jgi:glyoxylase-like metal-dependent hydrolase (beta-lactamase superfamily II)